jgi:hypothetical protein
VATSSAGRQHPYRSPCNAAATPPYRRPRRQPSASATARASGVISTLRASRPNNLKCVSPDALLGLALVEAMGGLRPTRNRLRHARASGDRPRRRERPASTPDDEQALTTALIDAGTDAQEQHRRGQLSRHRGPPPLWLNGDRHPHREPLPRRHRPERPPAIASASLKESRAVPL